MTTPATTAMVEQMNRYFNAVKERLGTNRLLHETQFDETDGTSWTWDLKQYINNPSKYDFLTCRIDIFYSAGDGGYSPIGQEPSQVIFKYSITNTGILHVTKTGSLTGVNPPYRLYVYFPTKRYIPPYIKPEVTFDGEITGNQLISMQDLAALLGVTEGVAFNLDTNWLKFNVNETTLYVAKKPIRHSLSWDHLNGLNTVNGSREINIGANRYKVRLLSGVNGDATEVTPGYDTPVTHNSEWNELMYHIHSGVFTDPLNKITSEGITAGNLGSYSDEDLGVGYNVTGAEWTQLNSGPVAASKVSAVSLNEYMYVFDGFVIVRYSDDRDWEQNVLGSSLLRKLDYPNITTDGEKIFVSGYDKSINYLNTPVYQFDWDTGNFTFVSQLPQALTQMTVCHANYKLFYYGGNLPGVASSGSNVLYIYSILNNTWEYGAPGPQPIDLHSAVYIDGKMYVYGGTYNGTPQDKLYIYDTTSNTWSSGPSGPYAVSGHSAVYIDGKMYVYGGNINGTRSNKLLIYDILSNSWSSGPVGPVALTGHSAGQLSGNMYIYGGQEWDGYSVLSNGLYQYNVGSNDIQLGTNSYCLNDLSGNIVGRGKYGISYVTTTPGNDLSETNGWRPVLELVASDPRNIIFEGEITGNQLISMSQLTTEAGVTQGSAMNLDTNWLKFLVDNNPIYVAKRPIRNNLSYNALETLGLTDGSKVLTIGQAQYRLRLLKSSIDNTLSAAEPGYDPSYTHGSEWNELMYRIHSGTFTDPNNTMASVGSAASSEAQYTDEDLGLGGLENKDWSELAKLVASDGAVGDYFGYSVSISADGTTALIGAYLDDDKRVDSGSAYIFTRNGSSWIQSTKLVPTDGASSSHFGISVSISADGTTALVGSVNADGIVGNSGSAYIFTRNGSGWIQSAKLIASDGATNDYFGRSVSISADGSTALVGSYYDDDRGSNSGSTYVFIKDGSNWIQSTKLVASDGSDSDLFGYSVSISADGTTALVGAHGNDDNGDNSGSAYIFTRNGSNWIQSAKLVASDGTSNDYFGHSVSISADGTTALVGAHYDDDKGNDSGSAYIFTRNGSSWIQSAKLMPTDGAAQDRFGYSVSISADGTTALVGAFGDDDKGSTFVFIKEGSNWIQSAKLVASDSTTGDGFGWSVSISADGTTALIGAYLDDDKGVDSGSAYIFTGSGRLILGAGNFTLPSVGTDKIVTRGLNGVSYSNSIDKSLTAEQYGWRPVLEYIGELPEPPRTERLTTWATSNITSHNTTMSITYDNGYYGTINRYTSWETSKKTIKFIGWTTITKGLNKGTHEVFTHFSTSFSTGQNTSDTGWIPSTGTRNTSYATTYTTTYETQLLTQEVPE